MIDYNNNFFRFPITVKLTKKHLKAEIESKLHKTSFFLDYKGTTKTVQVCDLFKSLGSLLKLYL